jgi:hypothetical protein
MKVEHIKGEKPTKKEVTYPCLMKSSVTGCIVLMISDVNDFGKGIMVFKGEERAEVGHYSSDWHTPYFTPLPSTEQIILQND